MEVKLLFQGSKAAICREKEPKLHNQITKYLNYETSLLDISFRKNVYGSHAVNGIGVAFVLDKCRTRPTFPFRPAANADCKGRRG